MGGEPRVVVPAVGGWRDATVTGIRPETAIVTTFGLQVDWPAPHVAGQHVVVRLTAPDGYSAQRSYSIASAPGDGSTIDIAVERFPDGEVSTFLHDEVRVGDRLEVRGPIGGWFVWDGTTPALLIGGGTGVVPLVSMLRVARRDPARPAVHLLVSARSRDELVFGSELHGDDTTLLFTRASDTARPAGRITSADVAAELTPDQTVYICGSARFAEAATQCVLEAGGTEEAIRVERFGPTN